MEPKVRYGETLLVTLVMPLVWWGGHINYQDNETQRLDMKPLNSCLMEEGGRGRYLLERMTALA